MPYESGNAERKRSGHNGRFPSLFFNPTPPTLSGGTRQNLMYFVDINMIKLISIHTVSRDLIYSIRSRNYFCQDFTLYFPDPCTTLPWLRYPGCASTRPQRVRPVSGQSSTSLQSHLLGRIHFRSTCASSCTYIHQN